MEAALCALEQLPLCFLCVTFWDFFPCWHWDAELTSTEANGYFFHWMQQTPAGLNSAADGADLLPLLVVTLDQSPITPLQIQSHHTGSGGYPG